MNAQPSESHHAPVDALAATQGGVFTTAQAYAAGYSRREVDRLLASGEWLCIRRGVHATAESLRAWSGPGGVVRFRAAAVLLKLESSVAAASHWTAASLHGLRRLSEPPAGTTITD